MRICVGTGSLPKNFCKVGFTLVKEIWMGAGLGLALGFGLGLALGFGLGLALGLGVGLGLELGVGLGVASERAEGSVKEPEGICAGWAGVVA